MPDFLKTVQFKDGVKDILFERKPISTSHNESDFVQASVLLPLFVKDQEYWVLLTKRTNKVRYHKGEVSFPGGVVDEVDDSLESTAKRETYEEIGVKREDIEILGRLDDTATMTFRYIIHPFVGVIPFPYEYIANEDEVDRIIEIPLSFFFNLSQPRLFTVDYYGKTVETPAYIYDGIAVWGATQRILTNFVNLLRPKINGSYSGSKFQTL